MKNSNVKKTGTTTVGIVCKDGIILAADKRATAGMFIAEKEAEKIHTISDEMAVTEAGTASDSQLLVKIIKAQLRLDSFRRGKKITVKEAANLLSGLVYSNIRKFSIIPGISHFILAGVDHKGFHLYDIFPDGTVSLHDNFVSSGSGSVMAYGVLETLYKEELNVSEGIKLAIRCINAAIQRDAASGEGIDIVTITSEGAKKIFTQKIDSKIKE